MIFTKYRPGEKVDIWETLYFTEHFLGTLLLELTFTHNMEKRILKRTDMPHSMRSVCIKKESAREEYLQVRTKMINLSCHRINLTSVHFNHQTYTSGVVHLQISKLKLYSHLGFQSSWVSGTWEHAVKQGHPLTVQPGVPQELQ